MSDDHVASKSEQQDASEPLRVAVLGTGKMLSDFKLLRKISIDN